MTFHSVVVVDILSYLLAGKKTCKSCDEIIKTTD